MVSKKIWGKEIMWMINALALLLVMLTANSACIWVAYQPEFPIDAVKYKR